MPRPDDALAAGWLLAAGEDVVMAERALVGDPVLVRPALFHSQQAAEKALKSVLARAGNSVPRTHDLEFLLDLGLASRPVLESLREDLRTLNDYAVQPRYPDDAVDYSAADARDALDAARRVVKAVGE